MKNHNWAHLLAYVTGLVNQQLLLQNEYLAAENRIRRAHLPTRLRLSDPQRSTLAEIGKRLGRKVLQQVAIRCRQRLGGPLTITPAPHEYFDQTGIPADARAVARHLDKVFNRIVARGEHYLVEANILAKNSTKMRPEEE